jgi:uncharacterized membrane-anchored protein YitT (DUF2179 family)
MKKEPKVKKALTASKVKESILDNLIWFAGCALFAAGISIFAVPNDIAQSGVTGLAIIVNHLLHTPVGLTNFVLNIPLIILAWIFLGWKFVGKTLWVTIVLSVMLDVLGHFLPAYSGDKLLASLFCGVITGAGLALVFMRGATTGGTDILALLFRKKWPHISMGRVILVADVFIVFTAAVVYRSVESALYAAIVIFVSTRVIDYVLYGTGNGKMLMVVTDFPTEISQAITTELKRGVTIMPVKGGYTGDHKSMLMCAVRSSEVSNINKIIWRFDPNPFIIICEAGEIIGEGFKLKEK